MFKTLLAGVNSYHFPDEHIYHYCKRENHVLLYTKVPAIFFIDEQKMIAPSNTIMLITPDSHISYKGLHGAYCDDWVDFIDTTHAISNLSFPVNTLLELKDTIPISPYFHIISQLFHSELSHNQSIISLTLNSLLLLIDSLYANNIREVPHYKQLLDLREQMYASPQLKWSIEKMAISVNLSPAYIQELYKKAFNISCNSDLIACRISTAKTMLTITNLSIEEIATRCGYNNPIHFSRQFKQYTGSSPSLWRAHQLSDIN